MNLEIKRLINEAGTQKKLALRVGRSQSAVQKWLHDETRPDAAATLTIEREFGLCRHKLRPDIFGESPA
jgi:DNA-binding transcriptional regulator YdaS (Cro superfamily)